MRQVQTTDPLHLEPLPVLRQLDTPTAGVTSGPCTLWRGATGRLTLSIHVYIPIVGVDGTHQSFLTAFSGIVQHY